MNTRKEQIQLAYDILTEAIGYAEIRSDNDCYQLALNTLRHFAEEGFRQPEIGVVWGDRQPEIGYGSWKDNITTCGF